MREYVPIFFDWVEVTGELNAQEKGRLIDAIVLYAQGGDWQEQIKGNERYLFPAFRKQIDRANETSENKSQAAIEREQKKAQKAQQSTKTTEDHKIPNNNNNKEEEDNNNKKDIARKRARATFCPPSVSEVDAYCKAQGYSVDADRFVAYYTANGWRVGRNPMKDWKAACRTWVRNGYDAPRKTAQTDYDQREYEDRKPGELPAWLKEEMEKEGAAV